MNNDLDFLAVSEPNFTGATRDDLTRALTEARTAMGGAVEAVTVIPNANGRSVGRIVSSNESWAAQTVGIDKVVMHQAQRVDRLPPKGATARFEYENGQATCMFPSRELGAKLKDNRIVLAPKNGRCSGVILGADFEHVYQKSFGDTVIAHRLDDLDRSPQLGSSPTINYSAGKAVFIAAKANVRENGMERGRAAAMSR